jgi:hypothetical protein
MLTGMFDQLFQPGRRHMEEEANRLALSREEPGDADPGRGPIDLDGGVVVVRPRTPAEPDSSEASADD